MYTSRGWNSRNHIRGIDAVERELGLKSRSLEILRIRNVADLQSRVDAGCVKR